MKIKHKDRMVKRAESNAINDVEFVSYVFFETREEADEFGEGWLPDRPFLACAVGCLCLPLKGNAREDFIATQKEIGFGKRLEEEFGIPRWLSIQAEDTFMYLERDLRSENLSDLERTEKLGEYVIEFAKALPEGYDFEDDVERYPNDSDDPKEFIYWLKGLEPAAA